MQWPDYLVLAGYFLTMASIGVWSMRRVHVQEDYFMGGRSFGKLLQTFAAFGSGTGSSDPVQTGRTTYTSGMSGMWSVMYWLFVTPFYWITAVWYRRMRHLTLGDWFVERYESRALGAAYAVFGILFYVCYGSMLFSAIGKVASPILGTSNLTFGDTTVAIEYVLVPVIGIVVLVYGILGGLRAAYWTDVIQGLCIILLSVLLIPFGLRELVDRFGHPAENVGSLPMLDGFRILHERLSAESFHIVGADSSSEFPLHRLVAVVIINLIGVVVQPHFIATGGGSAKTEFTARIGLVTGNFLKRLCTVGWVLTGLIAVALYGDRAELMLDPDKTWGVASRELLRPGLTGLMLACLLAALMSSVDAYMIVGSALIVRNVYAAYVDPEASEQTCVRLARFTGALIVGGAVAMSMLYMDIFEQLKITWIVPVLFAAPFWVGMYWRRATPAAAWMTILFCAAVFFLIPAVIPSAFPALRSAPTLLDTTQWYEVTTQRIAAPSDIERRAAAGQMWDASRGKLDERIQWLERRETTDPTHQAAIQTELASRRRELVSLGARPEPLRLGQPITEVQQRGGQSVFWEGGVHPVDDLGRPLPEATPLRVGPVEPVDDKTSRVRLAYDDDVRLRGFGSFRLDFLVYHLSGVELAELNDAWLNTLELPPKIVGPFLVMMLISLLTRPNSKKALDRYFAKMKTPVDPDPQRDHAALAACYESPHLCERKKLFPGSNWEFQRPTSIDVLGFVLCFLGCFAIIALAVIVVRIGG